MRPSLHRLATLILLITLTSVRLLATPIVVMRTKTGYIVGTNGTRDDGTRVCKLQYNNNQVTLHAAPIALSTAPSGEVIFDVNATMWQIYSSAQGYVTLGSLAQAIDDAIVRNAYRLTEVPAFQFHLINVAVGAVPLPAQGVHPEVIEIWMTNPKNWQWVLDEPFHKPLVLEEGEAFVWGYTPDPSKQRGEPTLAGVRKLLDSLIPEGDKGSFGPPYLIGELDQAGFRFISSDEGICTSTHPAPLIEERPIRKRRMSSHKRRS